MNDILVAWVLVLASITVGGQTGQQAPPLSPPPVASPPSAPLSFPSATRVAYFDPDRVFGTTNEGKRLGGILQAFRQKKFTELAERNKQLETLRAKRQAAGLLSSASLDLLDKDISRLGVEIERAAQDAEAEYNDRLSQVQADFPRLLQPVVERTLKEHGCPTRCTSGKGMAHLPATVPGLPNLVSQSPVYVTAARAALTAETRRLQGQAASAPVSDMTPKTIAARLSPRRDLAEDQRLADRQRCAGASIRLFLRDGENR